MIRSEIDTYRSLVIPIANFTFTLLKAISVRSTRFEFILFPNLIWILAANAANLAWIQSP